MRDMLIQMFFQVKGTANVIATVISVVSGILSIIELFRGKSIPKRIVGALIFIVSAAIFLGTRINYRYAEVPDVIGRTYANACNILSDSGLDYSLAYDNGIYVTAQNPQAGDIVKKETMVELETDAIGNNEEVRTRWEESLNTSFGNMELTFKRTDIELCQDGKTVQCIGDIIENYTVDEAYLKEPQSGVEYHDFIQKDEKLIFEGIPCGIEFEVHITLDGYEDLNRTEALSSQNMIDDTYSLSVHLEEKTDDMRTSTYFYIADGSKSTLANIAYMSGVNLSVQWLNDNMWYGTYQTLDNGALEYEIWIAEEHTVNVWIMDPFGNGTDYKCEIELQPVAVGEPRNFPIIFIDPNGDCYVGSM